MIRSRTALPINDLRESFLLFLAAGTRFNTTARLHATEASTILSGRDRAVDYFEIVGIIEATLKTESRLVGSERGDDADAVVWSRYRQSVRISRSGSTGILLSLTSNGKVTHERVFAQSPKSVERIARVITEHLMQYAQ